jgi:hypothetical protein
MKKCSFYIKNSDRLIYVLIESTKQIADSDNLTSKQAKPVEIKVHEISFMMFNVHFFSNFFVCLVFHKRRSCQTQSARWLLAHHQKQSTCHLHWLIQRMLQSEIRIFLIELCFRCMMWLLTFLIILEKTKSFTKQVKTTRRVHSLIVIFHSL